MPVKVDIHIEIYEDNIGQPGDRILSSHVTKVITHVLLFCCFCFLGKVRYKAAIHTNLWYPNDTSRTGTTGNETLDLGDYQDYEEYSRKASTS